MCDVRGKVSGAGAGRAEAHRFTVRDFGVEFAREHVQKVELDRLVRLGVGLRLLDRLRGLRQERRGFLGDLGEVLKQELYTCRDPTRAQVNARE